MKVSIIICSYDGYRDGNLPLLKNDIEKQTFMDWELIIIRGVSPVGKARNKGIKKAKGDIIIFFDDDVRLGKDTIKNLINGVKKYPNSIVGGSRIIFPNSNLLQRILAREIPREEIRISKKDVPTDNIGTYCWACRRRIYEKIGYFREDITAGEDTEFRKRTRENGYQTILLKNTYVFHPARDNLFAFLKQRYWYGKGIGQMRKKRYKKITFFLFAVIYGTFRIIFLPFHIFLNNINLYAKGKATSPFKFGTLYALGDIFYVFGYIREINEKF